MYAVSNQQGLPENQKRTTKVNKTIDIIVFYYTGCHLRHLMNLNLFGMRCKDLSKSNTMCIAHDDFTFPPSLQYCNISMSALPYHMVSQAMINSPWLSRLNVSLLRISVMSLITLSKSLNSLIYLDIKGMYNISPLFKQTIMVS